MERTEQADQARQQEESYSIKTVANLTNMNSHTIRAWERRYKALDPNRHVNGRRMYSGDDLARLKLLAQLVEAGHQISNIATLANSVLEAMRSQSGVDKSAATIPGRLDPTPTVCTLVLEQCVEALKEFDLAYINAELESARFVLTAQQFVLDVTLPLLRQVGRLVETEKFTMAQEHALSAILRSQLMQILFNLRNAVAIKSHNRKDRAKGYSVTLATVEGDLHEFGVLSAAILVGSHGHIPHYLGPNLPATPFADAAKAIKTDIVVVGSTRIPKDRHSKSHREYLAELDQKLVPNTAIWWGGYIDFMPELLHSGRSMRILGNMVEFNAALAQLGPGGL